LIIRRFGLLRERVRTAFSLGVQEI